MRNIFFLIFLLCCWQIGYSQFPITQNFGGPSTLTLIPPNGGFKASLINRTFTDTTAANLTPIDAYAGSQIFTTSDGALWVRNTTATKWLQILSTGSSSDTLTWKLGGNDFTDLSGYATLGSISNDPIYFMTNNLKRLGIPETGILRSASAFNKCLTFDTATKLMYYGDCSGGGGGGGINRIGLIDSLGHHSNGASTDGNSFFMETATESSPGLLSAYDKAKIDSLKNVYWYAITKTGYLPTAYRPNDSVIYAKALSLTMPPELTVTLTNTDTTGTWTVDYTGGRNPFVDSIDAITVKNIADLRATDYQSFNSYKKASSDRPMVNVTDYYGPGSGGGGQFYWDDTATVADNGGSIIKPTSVSGAGRWKRPNKGYMDVVEFGATRSYTTIPGTDSRANFINAINAEISYQLNNGASGLTGVYSTGTLRIPAGNYTISDSIKISNSITITGEDETNWPSNSTRLFFPVNKRGFVFSRRADGTGARNVTMKNIYLSSGGLSTDTLCHGIKANCKIDFYNVSVENFGGHGLYLTSLDSGDCSNSKIYSCLFYYNQLTGFTNESGENNNIVVSGNNSRTNGNSNFYENGALGSHYEFNHAASPGGRANVKSGWCRYNGYEYVSIGAENVTYGAKNLNIRPDSTGVENYWQRFPDNTIDTNIVATWSRTHIYPITSSYAVGNTASGSDFMNDYDEGGTAGVVLNLGSIAWNGDLANGVARPWMTWHRMGGGFFRSTTGIRSTNTNGDSSFVEFNNAYGLTFGKEINGDEAAFNMKYDTASKLTNGYAGNTLSYHSFNIAGQYTSPTAYGYSTIKPGMWTWSPGYGFSMAAMTNSGIKRNILADVASPTNGTHYTNDLCINIGSDASIIAWKCTVAGTPGTWVAMSTGGGGGTPVGNYGNLQINRNGVFATPASDTLIYTTSGGFVVKNIITGNALYLPNSTTSLGSVYMGGIKWMQSYSPGSSPNQAWGINAGSLSTATTNTSNISIGDGAGANFNSSGNIAIGYRALSLHTGVDPSQDLYNTAVGYNSMGLATGGRNNVAMGVNTLRDAANGSYSNVAIGKGTALGCTTCGANSIVGASVASGGTFTGEWNAIVGADVLVPATTATGNSILGAQAMYDGTSAQENTVAGYYGGTNITTATGNAFLGAKTGLAITDGSYNVFLGYGAGAGISNTSISNRFSLNKNTALTASNATIIGDLTNKRIGINKAEDATLTYELTVGGKVAVETIDSTGTGTAINMLYQDPSTGLIKKSAVPSGGGGGGDLLSTGNTFAANGKYVGPNDNFNFAIKTNGIQEMLFEAGANNKIYMGKGHPSSVAQVHIQYDGSGSYGAKGLQLEDVYNGGTVVLQVIGGPKLYVTDASGTAIPILLGKLENPSDGDQLVNGTGYWKFTADKLGVGVTPTEMLDVAGNIKASGYVISPIVYGSTSASGGVQIGSTSNGTKGVITMLDSVNFNGKSIEGYTAKYNVQTGTSYTLVAADAGKIITISNGSAITLTVPASLPAGFTCTVIQLGAGQITFTASSTTINNRQSYTKTAGQYAVATITQYTTNTFATAGDMQ